MGRARYAAGKTGDLNTDRCAWRTTVYKRNYSWICLVSRANLITPVGGDNRYKLVAAWAIR